MTTATATQAPEQEQERRPALRLASLMVLVLAVGLGLGLMTRARGRDHTGPFAEGTAILERWLGAALTPVAIILMVTLAGQVLERLGRREAIRFRVWPIAWRITAAGVLGGLLVLESSLLETEPSIDLRAGQDVFMNQFSYDVRLRVLPIASLLLMVGLILGMRTGAPGPAVKRSGLPPWLSATVAGLGGLGIVACQMIIPYLVAIAIEAVLNARMRPGEGASGFFADEVGRAPLPQGLAGRLSQAMPAAGLAVMMCLGVGGWLSSSLRGPMAGTGGTVAARQPLRILASVLLALLVLAAAGLLVFRSIRSVQPLLMDGLIQAIGPVEVAIALIGFLGFAMGLVARALDARRAMAADAGSRSPSPSRSRPGFRLARACIALALVLVILSSLAWILEQLSPGGAFLLRWLTWLLDPLGFVSRIAWTRADVEARLGVLLYNPALCLLVLIIPWLAWRAIGLLVSVRVSGDAPLDRVFDDRASTCLFLGHGLVLSALIAAAIPTMALAGLLLFHQAIGPLIR